MMRVFVNGISAKSGGGKSILTNFLTVLKEKGSPNQFVVLVPDNTDYAEFSSSTVEILPMHKISATWILPITNAFILPKLVRDYNCTVVFNLADIPVPTVIPQVMLFDWSYAAFPESPAWCLSSLKDRIVRLSKLFFFKRYLCYVDSTIAQTEIIKNRLKHIYKIKRVTVIPNAVSLENLGMSEPKDFNLGGGVKLLCLSRYYSHKNIEIFLPLAERIKKMRLDIKIITTISANQGQGAEAFLRAIEERGLDGIIVNVGPVDMSEVPSLYDQIDGLLLPTLLESFSGTYVEAMFHSKPIYTSDLDFARGVCGTAAYYFNPHDPDDILNRILESRAGPVECNRRISDGRRILEELLTWEQAYYAYINELEKIQGIRSK